MSDARLELVGDLYLLNQHRCIDVSFERFAINPAAFLWPRNLMNTSEVRAVELALGVSEGNRSGASTVFRGGTLFEKLRHHAWPRVPMAGRRKNPSNSLTAKDAKDAKEIVI